MEQNSTISQLDWIIITASGFITIEAIAAFSINSYLLMASFWLRRPLRINLLLCVSLCAANTTCAFFYVVSNVINSIMPYILNRSTFVSNCWSILTEACKLTALWASVLHLLALAVNHYVGIVHPFSYFHITRNELKSAIVAAYLMPFLTFLLVFSSVPEQGFRAAKAWSFLHNDGCNSNKIFGMLWYRIFVIAPFVFLIIFISGLYLHILAHTRAHRAKNRRLGFSTALYTDANHKLLLTVTLWIGSAAIGWLPTMVQYVIFCRNCPLPVNMWTGVAIGIVTQVLNLFKLIVDAFIYTSRLEDIRHAIWRMHENFRFRLGFHTRRRTNTSEELNFCLADMRYQRININGHHL